MALRRILIPLARSGLPALLALVVGVTSACSSDDDDARADQVKIPEFVNPSGDVEVGEFIVYREDDGRISRFTVARAGPLHPNYEVEVAMWREGTPEVVEESRRTFHRANLSSSSYHTLRSIRYDPIEAAGRKWESWRVEVYDIQLGYAATYWVTDQLPVNGWIRRRYTAKDQVFTMEVQDWGFAGS